MGTNDSLLWHFDHSLKDELRLPPQTTDLTLITWPLQEEGKNWLAIKVLQSSVHSCTFTPSLTHSPTHPPTQLPPTHPLTHSPTYSTTTHSPTHPSHLSTHLPTHPLTHPPPPTHHSKPPTHTYLTTHPPTHSPPQQCSITGISIQVVQIAYLVDCAIGVAS